MLSWSAQLQMAVECYSAAATLIAIIATACVQRNTHGNKYADDQPTALTTVALSLRAYYPVHWPSSAPPCLTWAPVQNDWCLFGGEGNRRWWRKCDRTQIMPL